MKYPAVAIFTYNRPEKSVQILDAVKEQGAENVYIFCDGPKENPSDEYRVRENKNIVNGFPIQNKRIFCEKKNKGLANSLIDGITKVFEFESNLIILEDDCLPFKQMLRFMAENLRYWQGCKNIFSISAYHFIRPVNAVQIPFDVFHSNRFLPWGWATWKDRWMSILPNLKERINPYGTFANVPDIAGRDLRYHSYAVEKKMVDSWAIPLGLITLFRGYQHIMPVRPLVNNIGMDDSGTNTGSAHNRIIPVKKSPRYSFPLTMCPNAFKNEALGKLFVDSLDVMLPPRWLKDKIHAELNA